MPVLLDWVYATYVEHLDKKDRDNFDRTLDGILYAEEYAAEEKRQRREIARLNARS